MDDAKMVSLQDLYLMTLAAVCEAEKLDSVIQQTGEGAGRIWLMRKGTTVPHAWIGFKFGVDDVALMVQTRNERQIAESVQYAGGLDSFLPRLQKILRDGLLGAPKVGDYESRVQAYEAKGMSRSDAQGVADADDLKSSRPAKRAVARAA